MKSSVNSRTRSGVQGIDTETQLSRPLLLSCRIRLPCVDKVYTCAQAEPGPTRLLPNHLGLPQTNDLENSVHLLAGIAPPDIRRTVACRMELTRQTTDARHQLFHRRPAASRLKSQKSFMRTFTPLDSSVSSSRLRLWKDSLKTCQPPSKWDWRWPSLCRLDLDRTGAVGELL